MLPSESLRRCRRVWLVMIVLLGTTMITALAVRYYQVVVQHRRAEVVRWGQAIIDGGER